MQTLVETPEDVRVRIADVQEQIHRKLLQYGLHVGDVICVLRKAPFGGPLLVSIHSREIAISREIAEKILVSAA